MAESTMTGEKSATTQAAEAVDTASILGPAFKAIKMQAFARESGEADDGDGGRDKNTGDDAGRKAAPKRAEADEADGQGTEADEDSEDEGEDGTPAKTRKEPSYVKIRVERAKRQARQEAEEEFAEKLAQIEEELSDFRDLRDATGLEPREILNFLRAAAKSGGAVPQADEGYPPVDAEAGDIPPVIQKLLAEQRDLKAQLRTITEETSDEKLSRWLTEMREAHKEHFDEDMEDRVLARVERNMRKRGVTTFDKDDLIEAFAAERLLDSEDEVREARERGRQEAIEQVKSKRALATDRGTDSGDRGKNEPNITPEIRMMYQALGLKKLGVTLADYARDVAKEREQRRR
ncbi:MAG: hypothetical protein AB1760_00285 [Pseudomonadota bacterium]